MHSTTSGASPLSLRLARKTYDASLRYADVVLNMLKELLLEKMSSDSSGDEVEGEVILGLPLTPATRESTPSKKDKQVSPAKGWAVTIFKGDWTPENWRDWFGSKVPLIPICKYIAGLEKCPKTGKFHLQCYFNFDEKIRAFMPLKKAFDDSIFIEKAKAKEYFNYKYCSKEKDFLTNYEREPVLVKKNWRSFEVYIRDFVAVVANQVQDVQDHMARLMFQERTYEVIISRQRRQEIAEAIFLYLTESNRLPERRETSEEQIQRQRNLMRM